MSALLLCLLVSQSSPNQPAQSASRPRESLGRRSQHNCHFHNALAAALGRRHGGGRQCRRGGPRREAEPRHVSTPFSALIAERVGAALGALLLRVLLKLVLALLIWLTLVLALVLLAEARARAQVRRGRPRLEQRGVAQPRDEDTTLARAGAIPSPARSPAINRLSTLPPLLSALRRGGRRSRRGSRWTNPTSSCTAPRHAPASCPVVCLTMSTS